MADDFTAIRVKPLTQIKLKQLAATYQMSMSDLAAKLVDAEWREAVRVDLVTDKAIEKAQAETEAQS